MASRTIALSWMSILRMPATKATLVFLPFARSRSQKFLMIGIGPLSGDAGHVERTPHDVAAAFDMSLAGLFSAIDVEGSKAHERGDLSAAEGAQFREEGDEGGCGTFSDAGGGAQQRFGLAPEFGGAQESVDVAIGVLDALLEEFDVVIDAAQGGLMSAFAAILFGGEHLDQLGAAQDEGLQLLGLLVVQRAHRGLDCCAVVSDDARIDAIGLGQASGGLGEIADPFGIDGDARKPGLAEGFEDGPFELSGGFEHDPLGLERDQLFEQRGDAVRRIGEARRGVGVVIGDVEERAADIDADEQRGDGGGIEFGSPQHPYLQRYELEAQSTVRVRSGKRKRRHQLSFGLRAHVRQNGLPLPTNGKDQFPFAEPNIQVSKESSFPSLSTSHRPRHRRLA